jgi:hypothetical protein
MNRFYLNSVLYGVELLAVKTTINNPKRKFAKPHQLLVDSRSYFANQELTLN